MPLAENSWVEVLASFPTQMRLSDGLYGCLDFLVRLTRWSGLGTTFSSRQSSELASLPWQGNRMGPRSVWLVVWGPESGERVH